MTSDVTSWLFMARGDGKGLNEIVLFFPLALRMNIAQSKPEQKGRSHRH